MINYLKSHYGNRPSSKQHAYYSTLIVNENEHMELQFLRTEVEKLKKMVGVSCQKSQMSYSKTPVSLIYTLQEENKEEEDAHSNQSASENESSEEEEVLELPQTKAPVKKGPRSSVSAEVFGAWNKKQEFKAPFFEKSPAVREALKKRIEQAFMFSGLNPEELSIVLDAMQNIKKKAGEQVIREGDEGDCLYVVESGILSCTKIFVRYLQI